MGKDAVQKLRVVGSTRLIQDENEGQKFFRYHAASRSTFLRAYKMLEATLEHDAKAGRDEGAENADCRETADNAAADVAAASPNEPNPTAAACPNEPNAGTTVSPNEPSRATVETTEVPAEAGSSVAAAGVGLRRDLAPSRVRDASVAVGRAHGEGAAPRRVPGARRGKGCAVSRRESWPERSVHAGIPAAQGVRATPHPASASPSTTQPPPTSDWSSPGGLPPGTMIRSPGRTW
jgi:hypothetical protein